MDYPDNAVLSLKDYGRTCPACGNHEDTYDLDIYSDVGESIEKWFCGACDSTWYIKYKFHAIEFDSEVFYVRD